jgi:hypothetical protein
VSSLSSRTTAPPPPSVVRSSTHLPRSLRTPFTSAFTSLPARRQPPPAPPELPAGPLLHSVEPAADHLLATHLPSTIPHTDSAVQPTDRAWSQQNRAEGDAGSPSDERCRALTREQQRGLPPRLPPSATSSRRSRPSPPPRRPSGRRHHLTPTLSALLPVGGTSAVAPSSSEQRQRQRRTPIFLQGQGWERGSASSVEAVLGFMCGSRDGAATKAPV